MDLRKIGWKGMDWMQLAQDRDQWRSFVNMVMNLRVPYKTGSDSSVGIALDYGLDDRGSRVRFPAEGGNFSLHHRVQNGSGAHLVSYPMGTRGCFLEGKAAGA
jgi:hypothetical protein